MILTAVPIPSVSQDPTAPQQEPHHPQSAQLEATVMLQGPHHPRPALAGRTWHPLGHRRLQPAFHALQARTNQTLGCHHLQHAQHVVQVTTAWQEVHPRHYVHLALVAQVGLDNSPHHARPPLVPIVDLVEILCHVTLDTTAQQVAPLYRLHAPLEHTQ
jgi:hypothetical protein